MKKVTIDLFANGLSKMQEEIDNFSKNLEKKGQEFVKELAKEGVTIATLRFGVAPYTGTNDTQVSFEMVADNTAVVRATGSIVLFIEFGTGIIYPDTHPDAHSLGMVRGEYGYGLGKSPRGWRYKGDPGTLGVVIEEGKHAGEVHTIGMPASMPMYETIQKLEQVCVDVARRVFND